MFSCVAGIIHVSTSVIIGFALIGGINLLGFAEMIEKISPMILIFIGFAYAIISAIKGHTHIHSEIGLSPCIPLIPLMLAANDSAFNNPILRYRNGGIYLTEL